MTSNHKSNNTNRLLLFCTIILIVSLCSSVYTNYLSTKRERVYKSVLRESFDREIGKTTILRLYEPASHELILDTLFKVWLEKRSSTYSLNTK